MEQQSVSGFPEEAREREERTSLQPCHTHNCTNTHTHKGTALPSQWLTEAAGASGVKGHGFSPENIIVVCMWTNNSIYTSSGPRRLSEMEVFGLKLGNSFRPWPPKIKLNAFFTLCRELTSSIGLKWDVSRLKRLTSDWDKHENRLAFSFCSLIMLNQVRIH